MIDRFVHHAEVIALDGDSYRLLGRDLGRVPPPQPMNHEPEGGHFSVAASWSVLVAVDKCVACNDLREPDMYWM